MAIKDIIRETVAEIWKIEGRPDLEADCCDYVFERFDEDNIKNAKEKTLERGDNFHVYTGLRHQMIALEESELFEFSTEHFDSDSYRIEKGD